MEKILKYSLILLSLIISSGGIIYKIYALNNIGIILNLTISVLIFIIIIILNKKVNFNNTNTKTNSTNWTILTAYISISAYVFTILVKSSTLKSIISPWQQIPLHFFGLYLLATILLLIYVSRNNRFSVFCISIHYFLSFSIATFIYKLGYGFDPFIHEAAINHIIKFGTIEPKTLYYSGYYSLIIALHKTLFIPTFYLNKFITPFLASIFLPITLSTILKKWLDSEIKINYLIIALLFLPFSIFTLSTPQNLAYLFLFLAVLLSLKCNNYIDLIAVYFLALSSFFIQPIAGIPAILLAIFLTIYYLNDHKLKKYFYIIFFLIASMAIPLIFLFLNNKNFSFNKNLLSNLLSFFITLKAPNQENIFLNGIYFINYNIKYFLFYLIIYGLYLAWKNKKQCEHFFIYPLMMASSLLSYLFLIIQPFDYLISYERANYANRLLIITVIFSMPFITLSTYKLISNIFSQNNPTRLIIGSIFSTFLLANVYLSYARNDNYYNSHGTSTSNNDIQAVQWINQDAKHDFVVLANQQVSAASLHEFEFKKYYKINNEDVFYYPLPTGGTLYQYYLKMVDEKPSQQNAQLAMTFTNTKTCYFVLNKYWWAFPKIFEEAKNEADYIKNINNEVYIFKYNQK